MRSSFCGGQFDRLTRCVRHLASGEAGEEVDRQWDMVDILQWNRKRLLLKIVQRLGFGEGREGERRRGRSRDRGALSGA
eukprot:100530-Chlamydomonas_euryale.AAC.1